MLLSFHTINFLKRKLFLIFCQHLTYPSNYHSRDQAVTPQETSPRLPDPQTSPPQAAKGAPLLLCSNIEGKIRKALQYSLQLLFLAYLPEYPVLRSSNLLIAISQISTWSYTAEIVASFSPPKPLSLFIYPISHTLTLNPTLHGHLLPAF